ncbi:capsular biosynthesis protein [Corynebacterium dentalis]|uniref:capsular biosynthesis protein n=1 Tax=Corynebacterium dentalis TaxID=2014528 RepID=UPI000C08D699|nr:capsular biosynthesis protein [Corynebacterium dentalis]
MKRIVVDVDNTISFTADGNYQDASVDVELVEQLHNYKDDGFEIVLYTARNMRTHEGNIGKINAKTLPILIEWLNKNNVPYDEIWTGKPWNGRDGFYIDDKAIRPNEFKNLSYSEIQALINTSEA